MGIKALEVAHKSFPPIARRITWKLLVIWATWYGYLLKFQACYSFKKGLKSVPQMQSNTIFSILYLYLEAMSARSSPGAITWLSSIICYSFLIIIGYITQDFYTSCLLTEVKMKAIPAFITCLSHFITLLNSV